MHFHILILFPFGLRTFDVVQRCSCVCELFGLIYTCMSVSVRGFPYLSVCLSVSVCLSPSLSLSLSLPVCHSLHHLAISISFHQHPFHPQQSMREYSNQKKSNNFSRQTDRQTDRHYTPHSTKSASPSSS